MVKSAVSVTIRLITPILRRDGSAQSGDSARNVKVCAVATNKSSRRFHHKVHDDHALTLPSPAKRARVRAKIPIGLHFGSKPPRPFLWERAGVRAYNPIQNLKSKIQNRSFIRT